MSEDFWSSPKGIEMRLQDLAESITWHTVNNAIQILGSNAGAKELEWVTEIDDRSCNFCDSQSGRRYKFGQFIPLIPHHPHCRCHWDLIFPES